MASKVTTQTCRDLDDIAEDIGDNIFTSTTAFYRQYFQEKLWWPGVEEAGHKLVYIPFPLSDVGIDHLLHATNHHAPISTGRLVRLSVAQKPYHVVTILPEPLQCDTMDTSIVWKHASLIGLCNLDPNTYLQVIIDFVGIARMIFSAQPTRLFLHGFYMSQNKLELWLFDRSAVYCCPNIGSIPGVCPGTILASYLCMGEVGELGNNTQVFRDIDGQYLLCKRSAEDEPVRVRLDSEPFWTRGHDGLIDDGLACYKATSDRDSHFVVKFKWSSEVELEREKSIFRLAESHKIPGLVNLFDHQVLGNTKDGKRGLEPSLTRRSLVASDSVKNHDVVGILEHTAEAARASPPDEKLLGCLVTYPVGRPIFQFASIEQLLWIMRDVISTHRLLYQHANVLHQDISTTNIMITSVGNQGPNPQGLLIDLDSAQDLSKSYTTAPTGTRPFMAIEVLESFSIKGIPHTYRHDLESFFYVFLYLAVCEKGKTQPPATSKLQKWICGKPVDQHQQKLQDMEPENFENILDEFTSDFRILQNLARDLREILFPSRDGKIWVGTDPSQDGENAMYDAMVQVFETAAASMRMSAYTPTKGCVSRMNVSKHIGNQRIDCDGVEGRTEI